MSTQVKDGGAAVSEPKLPYSVTATLNTLVAECLEAGRLGTYAGANTARRDLVAELLAWNTRAPDPTLTQQQEEIGRLRSLLRAAISSADRNCPCHEETPNPCPKCGASVENLEACRAGELTLPVGLYDEIRAVLESRHAD